MTSQKTYKIVGVFQRKLVAIWEKGTSFIDAVPERYWNMVEQFIIAPMILSVGKLRNVIELCVIIIKN